MYELKYKCIVNDEAMTITALSESHAIDKYKRETAFMPNNYKIISIVNTEENAVNEAYNNRREAEQHEVLKQVNSTIKAILKKPYATNNKKKEKTIKAKTEILDFIKSQLKQYKISNGYYLIDNKIEINISYAIFINPTEDFYLSA